MTGRGSFAARFRAVAAERIARVVAALDAGDADEARREMHGLKGEARIVGFEAVAQIAHALETRVAEGEDRARLDEGIALIDRALELDPDDDVPGVQAFLSRGEPRESVAPSPAESLRWIASRAADSFLRVDMAVLAQLTRAVSEVRATERALVGLVESLTELLRGDERERARRALASARHIAFDHRQRSDAVADGLRRLRMVPLAHLFEPFPRAIAQLASQLGKKVEVVVTGADVEVDRQVLDVVTEPLVHLIRNAIDHGIEPPDERRARGKSASGHIHLRARAAYGSVDIEVEDDGAGVDLDAVRATRAIDGDEALLEALCQHGFSTRERVSDVSGRGVGLDVVKRRVESVGGRLKLRTEVGRGTTFALELPTSMVLGTMVCVDVDGARYALPPHEVREVLDARDAAAGRTGGGSFVRGGGRAVPLFDLGVLTERAASPRERARVLVLQQGDRTIALSVDAFRGTRAVSEQRLDPFLERIEIIRSVAVLANGELAVALDGAELIRRASSLDPRDVETPAQTPDAPARASRPRRVLVVDDSELTRDLVVATLRDMGLDVLEAVDGARALERLEAEEVGLVVTDLDMPVLDGFELIRRIRNTRAHLPIVVLSTRGDDADVRRASELGADAYLVKSRLELEHLRRVVHRYVGAA